MKIEIKDEKPLIYISQGDILVDTTSSNEAYLVNFDGFNEKNKVIYKLIPLNGSNNTYNDELYENDIKQLIIDNSLVHYPKDEYKLSLNKVDNQTK